MPDKPILLSEPLAREDVFHCEFCNAAGLDDMHSHGDIYLCEKCHASVLETARTCQHEWQISDNPNGETGVYCPKCGIWKQWASTPL